jgi:beta-glucosidase/6-phospho-beta-glucosidase/beta-galactosidase
VPLSHCLTTQWLLLVLQILKALRDGVDVRGLYYWTLIDNFEWNAGYSIK